MGRPAKHTTDDFVDAAVALFARSGVRAVTLGAVADALGAANGSVYHRFADRPSLLAAVWLRTSRRFAGAYRVRLGDPTVESVIATAVWVVEWCRENLAEAQVLLAGMRAFGPDEWPAEARAAATTDEQIGRELRASVRRLAAQTAASPEEIVFAMAELPIAVVRRPLQAGQAPGPREADLVRRLAARILTTPAEPSAG
ncbi:TetR/AcrR family transcriptional regulator [Nocardioides sp. R1-1]|uniref:TetR/AcrR family transcriptional regulator n=1 Tax=Nocardioides sp. R1-1 TaxID=3383502 RepID=UPI0038D20777